MERSILFLLAFLLLSANTDAKSCESGWLAYENELCFQLLPNKLTFADAVNACSSKGDNAPEASLIMTKSPDIQDLLMNYTLGIHGSIWLGGKYFTDTGNFKWLDGEALEYTNWMHGHPGYPADETCIEFRRGQGKWVEMNCQRRNLVICQKAATWSLLDTVDGLKRLQKEHEEDTDKLNTKFSAANGEIQQGLQQTNFQLNSTTADLNTLKRILDIAIADIRDATSERNSLKQTLEQVSSQLSSTRVELTTAKRNLDTATANIRTATNDRNSIKQTLQQVSSQLTSTRGELTTVKRNLDTTTANLRTANNEISNLKYSLQQTRSQLSSTTSGLNSLKSSAITDIRFGPRVQNQLHKARGIDDTSGYVVTGIVNHNHDSYVDDGYRRLVQKYRNGGWSNVAFT